MQCEICVKPKPTLSCCCFGPTCSGPCPSGIHCQGQFFCQVITCAFPCNADVPCIINTCGFTHYPEKGRGWFKKIKDIRRGQATTPDKASTEAKGAPESEMMQR